jgi:ankyrin repeat protein
VSRSKIRRGAETVQARSVAEIRTAYEFDPARPRFTSIAALDEDGDTLLHRAVFRGNRRDVRELLELGSNVNAHGDFGHTPLHYAAMRGRLDLVELLLAAGADHTALNEWKQTPAQCAEGDDVVRLLTSTRRRQRARSG